MAAVSAARVLEREQRHRGALHGLGAAPVEEAARAGDGVDHVARAHRPRHAPAGVAPVLGEAVEEDDGRGVDVLDVARGALHGGRAAHAVDVVRVELVEEEGAVELLGGADPGGQLLPADVLAGGVAGVRREDGGEAAALDLAAQVAHGEGVAALGLQQDGDGGEEAEDVEQLLVGGVVGEEVAEVDLPERRRRAGEGGAATAGDGDVLRAVARGHAAAVGAVVEVGDGLAQLPQAGDRGVLLIVHGDGHRLATGRRAGQGARLRLALAEVAPAVLLRLAAVAVAVARGLAHHVDDAGARHLAEGAERSLFGEMAGRGLGSGGRRVVGDFTAAFVVGGAGGGGGHGDRAHTRADGARK